MVASNQNTPYKGAGPKKASYARGGDVVTTRSRFLKSPDSFRTGIQKNDFGDGYDPLCKEKGETKALKAVKPRT